MAPIRVRLTQDNNQSGTAPADSSVSAGPQSNNTGIQMRFAHAVRVAHFHQYRGCKHYASPFALLKRPVNIPG